MYKLKTNQTVLIAVVFCLLDYFERLCRQLRETASQYYELAQALYDYYYARVMRALFGELWRDKRAQGLGAGVVGTLVGIMVALLIAIIVVMNLVNSQDQSGWSQKANDTWSTLQNNIWTALTLLVIVPIIIGAIIILSYVRRGF